LNPSFFLDKCHGLSYHVLNSKRDERRTAMAMESRKRGVVPATEFPDPKRKPGYLRATGLGCALTLFLLSFLCLLFFLSREKNTFMAMLNPEQIFQEEEDEEARLAARKSAILQSLNDDINRETRGSEPEDNRLLARLDRLWRSVKRYVAPQEDLPASAKGNDPQQAVRLRTQKTEPFPPLPRPGPEQIELEDVLHHLFSHLDESVVIRGKRVDRERDKPQPILAPVLAAENAAMKVPAAAGSGGSRGLDEFLYNLEPRGGVRTRGVAWRVHRNLTLEGTVDTTPVGQIDGDLGDFGFRSVHALTFLRDVSRPLLMMGDGRIDSGYPRSYGIGLNFRLSSSMQMLFDYSHEYPSDYFIEYRGNWESSLLADYAKKRPENRDADLSIHNFFFGLRYLYRLDDALVPVHTGFFYSTNLADETLLSDVSMGFSLGGGYQKKEVQLGVSYRLRIWDNPDDPFLMAVSDEDIKTRVSNQVLFFIAF